MRPFSIFLILATFSFEVSSQSELIFDHIGTEEGLPYNRIDDLTEDKLGFIWMASLVGVFRYDGLNFKLYAEGSEEHSLQDPRSAKNITRDSSGEIWSGDYALHGYDRDHDRFHAYLPDSASEDWKILSLHGDTRGNIWIGTENSGILRFDIQNSQFSSLNEESQTRVPNEAVSNIIEDQHKNIWFSYPNGVYRFDSQSGNLKYIALREDFDAGFHDGIVKSMFMDSHGHLWIGTLDGIYVVETSTGNIFKFDETSKMAIYSIGEPKDGLIWASGGDDVNYFMRRDSSQISGYSIVPKTPSPLSDQFITKMYRSSTGDFWVATMYDGIYLTSPQFKAFKKYDRLFDNDVYELSFLEQDSGQIMISTSFGIVFFDPNQDKFLRDPSLSEVQGTIAKHPDGWVWMASWQGLNKFRTDTKVVVKYNPEPDDRSSIAGTSIPTILVDQKGTVWIGVWGKGLYQYRPATDDFEDFPISIPSHQNLTSKIMIIYEDQIGNIWIGAESSLIKLRSDYSVDTFFHIADAFSIFEDENDLLWLATKTGLQCLDPNSGEISIWTTMQGLPHNWIRSIQGDEAGNLWLGTNNGLSKFNPSSGKFLNFSIDDGLPGKVFSPKSLKTQSGELYFSFLDGGLLRFYPNEIHVNPHVPQVVITDFKITNQGFEANPNISSNKKINLSWQENDLSIEFAALSYVTPQKNQYRYQLENYQNDWIYTDQKRPFAAYTNLDPGQYTFKVTGSNNDGVWNEEPISLSILITPPIWWNTWSKILYILGVLGGLWFLRRYEQNRTQLRHAFEVEKVKAEEMEAVNELKSRFFTNISHEIRTPLTLILGPIKELIGKNRGKDLEILKIIQRNAYRLLQLMNQLLDISKIDAHAMPLQAVNIELVSFLRSVFHNFNSVASSRDIQYVFKTNQQELKIYFDPEKLEKILVNLLSNAFKFTPDGKEIEMQLLVNEKDVLITVKDHGIGIPEDQIDRVFDRFYQVDNSEGRPFEGSGVGLSLVKDFVELHHGSIKLANNAEGGTTFSIKLPLGGNHLTPHEIATNPVTRRLQSTTTIDAMLTEPQLEPTLALNDDFPLLMLIEDNQDMRTHIRHMLDFQYRVLELPDGQHALDMARNKLPDLIICDVMLPGITGFEICHSLKSDILTCHIPIIILSAKADQESKLEGLHKGADAYISKPFDKEELLTRIAKLLELREKLRNHYQSNSHKNGESKPESQDVFLHALDDLINNNLEDPDLTILHICRKMGVSRAQLYRKIKMLTNDSVASYISRVRLQQATVLLRAKNLNVSEIAYSVGFRDPAYFSRLYKKTYGVSPSEIWMQP